MQLSERRSLLAILQPEMENSGSYACSAMSGGSTASAVVTVNIGESEMVVYMHTCMISSGWGNGLINLTFMGARFL